MWAPKCMTLCGSIGPIISGLDALFLKLCYHECDTHTHIVHVALVSVWFGPQTFPYRV